MSTEKIQELARDIAREQYTDDPDDGVPASNAQWGEGDPHWWEDEDEEDPYDNYCLRHASEDEEFDDTPRNPYECYPGVVTYPFA